MTAPHALSFRPAGDQALVVELGSDISRGTNARVRNLDGALRASNVPGVIDTVPSYRALLVYYEPARIGYAQLVERVQSILASPQAGARPVKRWLLPVLYGAECAADLQALSQKVSLSPADIVAMHTSVEYMVYMVGFSPGFAYLGELPGPLEVPRKLVPAPRVPANSIQVGGAQTAVSSMPMPSGWYIIGRTAVHMYDLRREDPFLLGAGDIVRFDPIDERAFAALSAQAAAGELQAAWEWAE